MGYESNRSIFVTLNKKEKEVFEILSRTIYEEGEKTGGDGDIAMHIKATAKYGVTIADKIVKCLIDLRKNDFLQNLEAYTVAPDGTIDYNEDLTNNYDDGALELVIAYSLEPGHFGYSTYTGEDSEHWGYCFGRTSDNKIYLLDLDARIVFKIRESPHNPIPEEIKKWARENL